MLKKLIRLKAETKINLFLLIIFTVGVFGLWYPDTRALFISLMPYTLLLSMVLMFWMHRAWKPRHIIIFAIIALLGYFVEVLGVATGIVFGEYFYGQGLGFQLWGTPPMIGLNWLMLVYCAYVLFRKKGLHPVIQIVLASALLVAYDVLMEPVAIKLGMWGWPPIDVVPLQNYIAWFVISFVMLSLMHLFSLRFRNGVAPALFFIQMGFFAALNLLLS